MVHSFATRKYHCLKANDVLCSCSTGNKGSIQQLREHHLSLGSGIFGWQNYGPFVWKREDIRLILLTGPVLAIKLLQY